MSNSAQNVRFWLAVITCHFVTFRRTIRCLRIHLAMDRKGLLLTEHLNVSNLFDLT